jgi:type II secretory pathway component GspD/PulD (secretin)
MAVSGQTAAAGGREREVRVFTLQFAQAAELKDKIKTVLTDKATVETDEHANALVITDSHDNVAVAAELIRALDIDRNQDLALRVIPLKNANAADLAKELQPLYGNKDSKDPIQISANDRSNSLMVRSSQVNYKIIAQVIAQGCSKVLKHRRGGNGEPNRRADSFSPGKPDRCCLWLCADGSPMPDILLVQPGAGFQERLLPPGGALGNDPPQH